MPRYFFCLQRDDGLATDTEGSELPDLATARREAEASLRELLANAIRSGDRDCQLPGRIVVYDDAGEERALLSLNDILPTQLRRPA